MGKFLNSKEIGWKLRVMRQQAGFTQERLAEAMDITAQQVQKYESGSNKLNTDRLQQVAHILNVPEQYFFTDTDETMPLMIAEKQLLDSYRAIDNKDIQECLIRIANHVTKVK